MKNEKTGAAADDNTGKPRDIVERTFEFASRIVRLGGKLDEHPGVGRVLMSQILSACLKSSGGRPACRRGRHPAARKIHTRYGNAPILKGGLRGDVFCRRAGSPGSTSAKMADATIFRQAPRAGTSVPANAEEAQAAQSKPDFISKMNIALKAARETHLRLRLPATSDVVTENQLRPLIQEADEIKRVIGAIIVSSKRGGDL